MIEGGGFKRNRRNNLSKRNRRNRKDIVYGGMHFAGRHSLRQGSLTPEQHEQSLPTPRNINRMSGNAWGPDEYTNTVVPRWDEQHIPDTAVYDFVPERTRRGADGKDRGGFMVAHHPHLRGYNGPIHKSASGRPIAAPGYFAHPDNAPQAHYSERGRDQVDPSLRPHNVTEHLPEHYLPPRPASKGSEKYGPGFEKRVRLGKVNDKGESWGQWYDRKKGNLLKKINPLGGGGSKKKKKKYKPSKKTRRRTRRRTRRCTRRRRY